MCGTKTLKAGLNKQLDIALVFIYTIERMKDHKLTETIVYESILTPDKGYNIDKEKIKKDIILSYRKDKRKNNFKHSIRYKDYEFDYVSTETNFLNIFIRDEFFVKTRQKIHLREKYINVMEHLEQSYLRNNIDPNSYRESPWYTCVYCCDVLKDSSELVIEYDDNLNKKNIIKFKLEDNKIFIFPSTLKFFFSENIATEPNLFIVFNYDLEDKI